jgi:hypothetical protein
MGKERGTMKKIILASLILSLTAWAWASPRTVVFEEFGREN